MTILSNGLIMPISLRLIPLHHSSLPELSDCYCSEAQKSPTSHRVIFFSFGIYNPLTSEIHQSSFPFCLFETVVDENRSAQEEYVVNAKNCDFNSRYGKRSGRRNGIHHVQISVGTSLECGRERQSGIDLSHECLHHPFVYQ